MPRDGDSAVYELMELVQRERDPAAGRLYAEQRTKVRTAQKLAEARTAGVEALRLERSDLRLDFSRFCNFPAHSVHLDESP
jgi:hypothetical protein